MFLYVFSDFLELIIVGTEVWCSFGISDSSNIFFAIVLDLKKYSFYLHAWI